MTSSTTWLPVDPRDLALRRVPVTVHDLDAVGEADLAAFAVAVAAQVEQVDEPTGPCPDAAERMLRHFLRLCESPRTRRRTLALVKGTVSNGAAGRRFYAVLNRALVTPVARAAGVRTSALRLEVAAAQLVGVAMMRYVLEVEPVASADADDLVALMAPALRATLAG